MFPAQPGLLSLKQCKLTRDIHSAHLGAYAVPPFFTFHSNTHKSYNFSPLGPK